MSFRRTLVSSAVFALPFMLLASASAAQAPERVIESQAGAIRSEHIGGGLVHPWAIALLPDGRLLVTERNPGHLRIVDREGTLSEPVAGVPEIFRYAGPTDGRSQGGLFDVKLHPDFVSNRLVYLSFSKPTERGAAAAIVRGRLDEAGGTTRLADIEPIFEMKPEDQESSGLHFGGRMVIDAAHGHLFLTIGDRRNMSRAQERGDQAGKVIRLTLDGAPAPSSPFADDDEADDHIFAMGSRNSQAIALQPGSDALWSVEHGPEGGDRIDRVAAGANLGWPFIAGGTDYSGAPVGVGLVHEGMTSPLHVFEETVAPSGAAFYEGAMFANWRGNLLVGGLANESLMRVQLDGGQVVNVERIEIGRRIRDVQIAPDGAVWLLTEHEDGEILRLIPEG